MELSVDPNAKLRKAIKVAKDYTDQSIGDLREYTDEQLAILEQLIPDMPEIPEPDIKEIADGVIALLPKPGKKKKAKKQLEMAEVLAVVTDAIAGIQKEYNETKNLYVIQQAPERVVERVKEVVTTTPGRVDYDEILKYVEDRLEPVRLHVPAVGGTNALRLLRDVNLDGVPQDRLGNYLLGQTGGTTTPTFETVVDNLSAYPWSVNRVDGKISSIVWDTPGGDIVQTINRTNGKITSRVLSGDGLPSGITTLTQTVSRVNNKITAGSYS